MIKAFPYPTVMLFVELPAVMIIETFGISSLFMTNFIFKLPSLIFDFIGLHFITGMFPDRRKYAALPILFLYLCKRDGFRKTLIFCGSVTFAVGMGMLPFMSEGFREIVLFNSEQNVLTETALVFGNVELYIPVMAVLIVYLITFGMNIITRNLFVSLCGIVFTVFLALCPPMPGWYVWIVPYISLFFMGVDEGQYKNIVIYLLFNGLYLVCFIFLHDRGAVDLYLLNTDLSLLKQHNDVLSGLVFTLLAGTLTYIAFLMYELGVAGNSLYKRRNRPFTIGIAGDSGSGKSTLTDVAVSVLGEHNLLFIEGDGDHRWERGERYWQEYTHLNPKANFLYRQAHDLRQLRQGVSVDRVEYDHGTGKFTGKKKIKPKKYIALCGLHSLYLPQVRKNLDLKIYLDTDETLRRYWKIQRDIECRGYTKEKIFAQIESRTPDAVKYIHPQKKYADMILSYYDKTLTDCMENGHELKTSVRITISAAVDVEALMNELIRCGVVIVHDYSADLQAQTIDLTANSLEKVRIPVEEIADRLIPQLEEITREKLDDENGIAGILKLFMLLLISSKMTGEL